MTKKKRDQSSDKEESEIQTSGWIDRSVKTIHRKFPGAKGAKVPLRIVLSSSAHKDVLAHAKESTDRELCGVLLGSICQDDDGVWISAEQALRGETERQGGTHVTYTHKTWEKIYAVKDAEYPDLAILGWYHTHPGFGVQFSEMDLFIQRNFFSAPSQFALVVDPISDEHAVIANTSDGTPYLERIWIDAKEFRTQIPESIQRENQTAQSEGTSVAAPEVMDRLKQVEDRLTQVLSSSEQQRESHSRWFLMFGFFCATLLSAFIIYMVLDNLRNKVTPPKHLQMVEVPVKVNDEIMMVGMRVEGWKIPDGENLLKKMEMNAEKRALASAMAILQNPDPKEAAKALKEAAQPAAYMNIDPMFSFWWAIVATLLVLMMLVLRLFSRESRKDEPI